MGFNEIVRVDIVKNYVIIVTNCGNYKCRANGKENDVRNAIYSSINRYSS